MGKGSILYINIVHRGEFITDERLEKISIFVRSVQVTDEGRLPFSVLRESAGKEIIFVP